MLDYLEFPYLLNLKKHNIQIISGLDDINEECSRRNDKRLVQMKSQMHEQSHSMDRGRSVPRGQKQPSKHAVAAMVRNSETGSSKRPRNPAGTGNIGARKPGPASGCEPPKTPAAIKPEIKQEKQSPPAAIIEPPKPKKKKVEKKKLPEEESEKEEGECTDDSDE